MKNKINIAKLFSILLLIVTSLSFLACEDDNKGKYEMTSGVPTIYYVRLPDKATADSLLVGAFMGETICLVGDNLTSIQEIYFNDIKALLNINFITKNTLFVTVPRDVPNEKLDKLILITKSGGKVDYDFIVRIPAPEVSGIKCENVPEGGKAVIFGDYFFDNATEPFTITIGDYTIPKADILELTKTKVTFKAPAAEIGGSVSITTAYGNSGRTKDLFHDNRGFITGFEEDFVGGWGRPTHIENDPELSLSGNYVKFAGNLEPGNWTAGGNDFSINIWGEDNGVPSGNLFPSNPATSILKFDVNVLQAWSALPMIFAFYAQGSQEGYLWNDGTQPRAFWSPWVGPTTYTTDGWITVSLPISDFIYNGSHVDIGLSAAYGGLGISLHSRGFEGVNDKGESVEGTACSPVILIDNIRVIPGE
jgi:hypothetical protein